MGEEHTESLRERLEEYEQSAQKFRDGLAASKSELAKVREERLGLSHSEQEALAERYRSGLHGAELQEIQLRVDEGELTWDDVKAGKAGEELSDAYYRDALNNGPFFGQALQAAFNGVDFNDFAREHGLVDPDQENTEEDLQDRHWDRGSQPRWHNHEDDED